MKRAASTEVEDLEQDCFSSVTEDEEPDFDLYQEIIAKGERILPLVLTKYEGWVSKVPTKNLWRVTFPLEYHIQRSMVPSEEQAIVILKQMHLINQVPIKNMIYLYHGAYYCAATTHNKLFKFSKEHLEIVQAHIWRADYAMNDQSYSINARIEGRVIRFDTLVLPGQVGPSFIHHLNGDDLDYSAENLCIKPRAIRPAILKSLNQVKPGTSRVGKLFYSIYRDAYQVTYYQNGVRRIKAFSCGKRGRDLTYLVALRFKTNLCLTQ